MYEIESSWPIESVTVYPQSARILRRTTLALKKGENKITISHLPEGLSTTTLRIELARDSELKILDIYAEDHLITAYDENLYRKESEQLEKLLVEKKKLEMRYQSYLDEFALFLNKESVLTEFQENPVLAINVKSWEDFFKFLKTRLSENRAKAREVTQEWLQLSRQLEVAELNLRKYSSYDRVKEHRVIVSAEARIDCEETLDLLYLQSAVVWHPAYTLRANLEKKTLTLSLLAIVKQSTGQDWPGQDWPGQDSPEQARPGIVRPHLQLYFSTAIPQESCELPELKAKILKEQAALLIMPQPVAVTASPTASVCLADEAGCEEDLDEEVLQERSREKKKSPSLKKQARAVLSTPPPAVNILDNRDRSPSLERREMEEASKSAMAGKAARHSAGYPATGYSVTSYSAAGCPAPGMTRQEQEVVPTDARVIGAELKSLVANLDNQYSDILSLDQLWDTYSDLYGCLKDEYQPARQLPLDEETRINRHFLAGVSLLSSLGGFDYRYKAASANIHLPGSGQPVQVGLDIIERPLELIYFAIPLERESVYLKARFKNEGTSPYPAGPALVFAENNLLGNITLPTLGLNQGMEISLGEDRDIKVVRRETSSRSTAGLVGKEVQTSISVEIELISYKKLPVEVELLDRLPLTGNEKEVSVVQESLTPLPLTQTVRGILCWRLSLKPQEKLTVKFAYKIRHPEDFQLTMSYAGTPHADFEQID